MVPIYLSLLVLYIIKVYNGLRQTSAAIQLETLQFENQGIMRKYILHEPADLSPDGAPLVFWLHPFTAQADYVLKTGMITLADKEGFALVSP